MSEGRALTRMNLDHLVCGNAGCKKTHEPLVFQSNCHRGAPTWVRYDKDALPGVIEIVCARNIWSGLDGGSIGSGRPSGSDTARRRSSGL